MPSQRENEQTDFGACCLQSNSCESQPGVNASGYIPHKEAIPSGSFCFRRERSLGTRICVDTCRWDIQSKFHSFLRDIFIHRKANASSSEYTSIFLSSPVILRKAFTPRLSYDWRWLTFVGGGQRVAFRRSLLEVARSTLHLPSKSSPLLARPEFAH